VYIRLEPRWDSYQVRSAAVAVARELERRRPDILTAQWWKEDRGERVFVDFNQNAPHKTVFGAWCVRARPGAQVSTPIDCDEIELIGGTSRSSSGRSSTWVESEKRLLRLKVPTDSMSRLTSHRRAWSSAAHMGSRVAREFARGWARR
jgi:DNA primase